MTTPLWVMELADEFWNLAGGPESFPRTLDGAIAFATPVTVTALQSLSVRHVSSWLRKQRINCLVTEPDRPLRACLFARDSCGVIFLDAGDDHDEQRFSLAHELAHYLRHYHQPRARAVAHFGEAILDVFDGKRPPTPQERLHALLRNIRVGEHLHLLARDDGRRRASPRVAVAEVDADRLGCELLAPAALVVRQSRRRSAQDSRRAAEQQLHTEYGLPHGAAAWYATQLYPPLDDPLLRRLGISS